MGIKKNEFGVNQYPKGDVRRWFVLLSAIDSLKLPTLVKLAEYTGHNKGTIPADIDKIKQQLGVEIQKVGAQYSIKKWGPVIKKVG